MGIILATKMWIQQVFQEYKQEISERHINALVINSKNKYVRVASLEVTWWTMRMLICLQIRTTFWKDGRNTCLSYWMCTGSVMLSRYKYIQHNHKYLILKFKLLLRSWKFVSHQEVTKLHQNWFKEKVKYYCLSYINSLILFGIRENCWSVKESIIVQIHKKGQ
jgi:hypothetical protein